MCDIPSTPINESLRIVSTESGFTEGSEIVLQCDDIVYFPVTQEQQLVLKFQEEESGYLILLTYFVKVSYKV